MDLKKLIEKGKFGYVDPDITEANFPDLKQKKGGYKLFHFDRYISSEDVIKEMANEGFRPADLRELITWKDWNGKDTVVALGQTWRDSDGDRFVPYLYFGGGRRLSLDWYDGGWYALYRFLAVRNSSARSAALALEPLDLGTCPDPSHEKRIAEIEGWIDKWEGIGERAYDSGWVKYREGKKI